MSYPYTSDDIDRIEDECKHIDLQNEELVLIEDSSEIEIIEKDNNIDMDLESVKVVKNPTKIKCMENR